MVLSEEEENLVKAFREGRPIIVRCNFGLGVTHEYKDGRIHLRVDHNPFITENAYALKEEMESVIKSWSSLLGIQREPKPVANSIIH